MLEGHVNTESFTDWNDLESIQGDCLLELVCDVSDILWIEQV